MVVSLSASLRCRVESTRELSPESDLCTPSDITDSCADSCGDRVRAVPQVVCVVLGWRAIGLRGIVCSASDVLDGCSTLVPVTAAFNVLVLSLIRVDFVGERLMCMSLIGFSGAPWGDCADTRFDCGDDMMMTG